MATFRESCIEGISRVFGDEDGGLATRGLEEILDECGIQAEFTEDSASRSLLMALQNRQFEDRHGGAILAFLRVAMASARQNRNREKLAALRQRLNQELRLCDLAVGEDGSLKEVKSDLFSMPWPRFLFSFNGRINRRAFWLRFSLPYFVILYATIAVEGLFVGRLVFTFFFVLLGLWSTFAVLVKRLHDIDRSDLWVLVLFIPGIGSIYYLLIGCLPGTRGPNRFGQDPLGEISET